jgi:hypothetical protein
VVTGLSVGYIIAGVASRVILSSESRRTHDHILLRLDSTPAQSTSLLLTLASTIVTGFDPLGNNDQIDVLSKTVYTFGTGISSSRKGGCCLSEYVGAHLLHHRFAWCPRTHVASK